MDPIEYRLRKSMNDYNIYGDEFQEYSLEKRHGMGTLQKYKEILNLVPFRDVNTAKYENYERELRASSLKDYHDFAKRLTKDEKTYNPYRIKKFTLKDENSLQLFRRQRHVWGEYKFFKEDRKFLLNRILQN